MIPDHYVWLEWVLVLLLIWSVVFAAFPNGRDKMWITSLFTMPFGLTEPLFVPRYWNPPSLFDLAQKTRFDIESLIFCFAIGGLGAVLYDVLTGRTAGPMDSTERRLPVHREHAFAIMTPVIVFLALVWLPWNPIYPGIVAAVAGAIAAILCRPDLRTRTWIGGMLFLIFYSVLLQGLRISSPGYIERVWNLRDLTGVELFGMPVEELFFAASFGMYWSGVYEHLTWRTVSRRAAELASPASRP